jgi:transcriptional regulator with XRE-family HTH domain
VERLAAAKGWSDAELARRAKTNPQYIIKVRNHTRGIGKVMQKRFADAFGIDEGLLLSQAAMSPQNGQDHWKNKYLALLEKMDKLRDEFDSYKEKEKLGGEEWRGIKKGAT